MGSVASNVLKWECGGINIGRCRILQGVQPTTTKAPGWDSYNALNARQGYRPKDYKQGDADYQPSTMGRWPSNLIFSHLPDCEQVGTQTTPGYQINRFKDGAKPFGDGAGHPYESEKMPDEVQPVWECETGCPVGELNQQSGDCKTGNSSIRRQSGKDGYGNRSAAYGAESRLAGTPNVCHTDDGGGASRFFKQIQEEVIQDD